MSGGEALARVHDPVAFNDASWKRTIGAQYTAERRRLESLAWAQAILADPGPLLEALAEAGILHRHSAPLKRRAAGGWAMVYGHNHTVEGTRYVTEWEVDDDRG